MENYLQSRLITAGMRPYITAMEYVLDIDASEIASDPDVRRASDLIEWLNSLSNDLYSFGIEGRAGKASNAIQIMCNTLGYCVQQSIDAVADMLATMHKDLCKVIRRLQARYALHSQGERMQVYFESYLHMAAGNVQWHLERPQYRGQIWNGRRELNFDVALSSKRETERTGAKRVVSEERACLSAME